MKHRRTKRVALILGGLATVVFVVAAVLTRNSPRSRPALVPASSPEPGGVERLDKASDVGGDYRTSDSLDADLPRWGRGHYDYSQPQRDQEVLDQVLADLVANPRLKAERVFYGAAGASEIGLDRATFPSGYKPRVPGVAFKFVARGERRSPSAPACVLEIGNYYLDSVPEKPLSPLPVEQGRIVEARISGNRGSAGGGGCVYYGVEYDGRSWDVTYLGLFD